jgi:hypothetical protein
MILQHWAHRSKSINRIDRTGEVVEDPDLDSLYLEKILCLGFQGRRGKKRLVIVNPSKTRQPLRHTEKNVHHQHHIFQRASGCASVTDRETHTHNLESTRMSSVHPVSSATRVIHARSPIFLTLLKSGTLSSFKRLPIRPPQQTDGMLHISCSSTEARSAQALKA